MNRNRKMGMITLGAAMLLLLGGCGREQQKDLTEVTLNEVAHSVFYAPMYVAIQEGYFEEEGIDLTLVTGFGADKTMTAVLTGEADIGFMGSESTIYAYEGGMDDYVVSFAQLTQRAGNFLVAREPMLNFDWKDLKGKTVLGGRNGGMPEMVFEYILYKNGLDPETDVNIDKSVDFGATAAAFSGSTVDFTIEFEPYATMLSQKGDGYVVASLGEASGYVPYTSFCAKKSYLEQQKETVIAFMKALRRGMEYVENHSAREVAKCIAPQFAEMEEDALTEMIRRYAEQDTWKSDMIFEKEGFELLQNILMDAGVIEKKQEYEILVNTEIARKVEENGND